MVSRRLAPDVWETLAGIIRFVSFGSILLTLAYRFVNEGLQTIIRTAVSRYIAFIPLSRFFSNSSNLLFSQLWPGIGSIWNDFFFILVQGGWQVFVYKIFRRRSRNFEETACKSLERLSSTHSRNRSIPKIFYVFWITEQHIEFV